MKYNNGGTASKKGGMNLGGFKGVPKKGSTVGQGAKIRGTKDSTGQLGRENDPNCGKYRRKPGNP